MRKCWCLLSGVLLTVAGCAAATWKVIKEPSAVKVRGFEVALPAGWAKRAGSDLYLTHDGSTLQHILLGKIELDEELPNTKKKLTADMLIQEIAEILVGEMRADKNILGFSLVENSPARISGKDAFRLVYTYHNADGLTYKVIRYGFINEGQLWLLSYAAAEQHYFEKDAETFEKLVSEFKIL